MIKEMCGLVSFKRGDAFYRNDKVIFEEYNLDRCNATVQALEDFQVNITVNPNGVIHTKCSCPTLSSFQKDCQHIAAVLLAIYDLKRQGIPPVLQSDNQSNFSTDQNRTNGLITLFQDKPKQTSGHQLHFENRKVLKVEFGCIPLSITQENRLFGIMIKLEGDEVQNIRGFLKAVKQGNPSILSNSFTYDPSLHCFQTESDQVIQQLISVVFDETAYMDSLLEKTSYISSNHLLLIPPSSWDRILPMLSKASLVKIVYDGSTFEDLRISREQLPLLFQFSEKDGKGYQLRIIGLGQLIVLHSYKSALYEGKVIRV